MFHLEGIILIAVFCAVNASVIVNFYNDDVYSTTTQNLKACNLNECDQRCRRIGFPGGACVNNRCKCDIIRSNELEKEDQDQSVRVQKCNDDECNQLCQKLGLPSGLCVGDDCTCRSSLQNKESEESNFDQNLRQCNNQACDQLCRRMGFVGGTCVGDHCSCDNFLHGKELEKDNQDQNLHGCNDEDCNQLCQKLGFPSGSCIGDSCSCRSSLPTKVRLEENDFDRSVRRCNNQACDQLCRRLGLTNGRCVGDRCSCINFLQSKGYSELEENGLDQSLHQCENQECDQFCRGLGFAGGVCFGDSCICSGLLRPKVDKKPIEADEQENDINYNYVSDKASKNVDICSTAACEFACRDIGYPGGKCDKGKCTCAPKVHKDEISRSFGDCNSDSCYDRCRLMHYFTGICLDDGTCFSTNALKNIRICDEIACNIICAESGYIGGECQNDECLCF